MQNNDRSQNQPCCKNIVVISDQSWLRANTNFSGRDATTYRNLDVENAPSVSDDEFNASLSQERALRTQLRTIDTWGKSAEQVAAEMQAANLAQTLREWAAIHLRNITIQMKRGNSDVLLVPTTQILLEAAHIITHS